MSLAARVALATTALLVLVVVLVSSASVLALGRSLDARDSDLLRTSASRVQLLGSTDLEPVIGTGTLSGAPPLPSVALLAADGEVVADNSPPGGRSGPAVQAAYAGNLLEPTVVDPGDGGSAYLVQLVPVDPPLVLQTAGGPAEVTAAVVAVSRDDRDTTVREHQAQLARTSPVVVAVGGLVALVLARATLRPLRQMAREARRFGRGERGRLRHGPRGPARTEVAQMAAALDEAFAARWQAEDRMRDFIADASHELRTPLAAVHGWADLYLELSRDAAASPEAAEEVIGHVRRETDRMTRLVDEMLALARLESHGAPAPRPVDAVGLVAGLVAEAAALHPTHDVRPLRSDGVLGTVRTDASIERAVQNLLVNAVTHTPPGTTVTTSIDTPAPGTLQVQVADSGPGLSAAELSRAGERFWRAESGRQRPGGNGLGLAIAQASAQSLGGTLLLGRSAEGGLSATLQIPQPIVSKASDNAPVAGGGAAAPGGQMAHVTTSEVGTGPERPRGLGALGAWCASHPLWVVAAWLLAVVGTYAGSAAAGGAYDDSVDLPGSQVSTAADLLSDAGQVGGSNQVVLRVEDGTLSDVASEVTDAVEALGGAEGVTAVGDPFDPASPTVSPDGTIGYISLTLSEQPRALGEALAEDVTVAMAPVEDAGVEVSYAGVLGEVITDAEGSHVPWSEIVGICVAVVVLVVSFASVAAALLPIVTAVVAVLLGLGILGLMTAVLTFSSTSPVLATMIGLGVGIDYALFLLTRYRQDLMDGVDPVRAAARTAASSGHSALVAAGTVAVALLGLYASGVPFIASLGLAAVFTVATAALAALTLVPAATGLLGHAIDRFHLGTPTAEPRGGTGVWDRHAGRVSRRPWLYTGTATLLLLVLAAPLLDLRLGHVYDGVDEPGTTTRVAYDTLAEGFGPGINGVMTVVVDTAAMGPPDAAAAVSDIDASLTGLDGIASAPPLRPVSETLFTTTVVPTTGPDDPATDDLFLSLRDDLLPAAVAGTDARAFVTGNVPGFIEFSERVTERLLLVIAVVVVVSFLLLVATFRSIAVAIKAALLNLISIGASYGVIVAIFQWQWGSSLLGLEASVPIEAFVPMMMFAVVFGLSMDYEVFLVSRIRESWLDHGDTTRAVGEGLAATARVITAAALIMMSVFLSFVTQPDVAVKMLAIGLTVSVLLDATVVRLFLVPASMTLMGRYNWWIPRWLDRVMPHVEPAPLPPAHELEEQTRTPVEGRHFSRATVDTTPG